MITLVKGGLILPFDPKIIRDIMRNLIIAFIFVAFLIVMVTLSGCEHTCYLYSTPTGMYGETNKSGIEGKKTIDKDGNTTMTISTKKSPGIIQNVLTILTLGWAK